jgi:aryl-alcohol dehydrogenase-like predicted oxidoreductase
MGESENIIGRLLKETPEDQRKNVVIATKCKSCIRFEQVDGTQNGSGCVTLSFHRVRYDKAWDVPSYERAAHNRLLHPSGFQSRTL